MHGVPSTLWCVSCVFHLYLPLFRFPTKPEWKYIVLVSQYAIHPDRKENHKTRTSVAYVQIVMGMARVDDLL